MPRAQSHRYHRAMVGVPFLALIAVILMSVGVGVLLPAIPDSPLLGGLALLVMGYIVFAARFVHLTARFLHRHAEEQTEAAIQARSEAVEAQLAALQSQMNPHFLFNALNTVAALVRTNGRAAEATGPLERARERPPVLVGAPSLSSGRASCFHVRRAGSRLERIVPTRVRMPA